jgi:hypothetical protein
MRAPIVSRDPRSPRWGPTSAYHEAINDDHRLVHKWRVTQLAGLGIPGRSPRPSPTRSPRLALRIVR